MERGSEITGELLAVDGCWGGISHFVSVLKWIHLYSCLWGSLSYCLNQKMETNAEHEDMAGGGRFVGVFEGERTVDWGENPKILKMFFLSSHRPFVRSWVFNLITMYGWISIPLLLKTSSRTNMLPTEWLKDCFKLWSHCWIYYKYSLQDMEKSINNEQEISSIVTCFHSTTKYYACCWGFWGSQ